jgi:hypothetical protein
MQVVQTDGEPPNHGNTHFAVINWIWNNKKADRKMVVLINPQNYRPSER